MRNLLRSRTLLAAIAILGVSVGVVAQTSVTAPMAGASAPTAIGVSPQTAAEANRQAVPRSDTATVVRTSPNAVDATRTAASAAVGNRSVRTDASVARVTPSSQTTTMRPPRTDRN